MSPGNVSPSKRRAIEFCACCNSKAGGQGRRMGIKMQDLDLGDRGSHPDSCMWQSSGNKALSLRIGKDCECNVSA